MGYFGRLLMTLTGKAKSRLPDQMALLGAPQDLVARARTTPDEEQEALFIQFAEGKHACLIDWRATRDDIYEELVPLLSGGEKALLPPREDVPEAAAPALARLGQALRASKRALVHTESFGDFSFLILVPRERESEFLRCVGPWLIEDGKESSREGG